MGVLIQNKESNYNYSECGSSDVDRSKCEVLHSKAEVTYWLVLLLLTLLLPITLTLVSNAGLQCYISKLHQREQEIMLKRNSKGNELNNVKILLILFGVNLIICWCPMLIWQSIRNNLFGIRVKRYFCLNLDKWSTLFPWISPLLNALLYSFVRKQFQKDLKKFFTGNPSGAHTLLQG